MAARAQRGFSLVEVLLSLGMLAGVLLPAVWLFDLAARDAKSGRTASEALAVARSVLEEMQSWGFHQTHWEYGLDGTATSYAVDTRTNTYAAKWQATLDAKLYGAHAIIALDSLPPTSGTLPPLNSTRAIRITVSVFWQEGERHRSIQLSTTRL
jgi:type II secretory pathway pseudopilin PulG